MRAKKFAGVTEARVDHPLKALNSLPGVRCVWGAGGLQLPNGFGSGVMMLCRRVTAAGAFVFGAVGVNRQRVVGDLSNMPPLLKSEQILEPFIMKISHNI